jgi:hypothetical protein
MAALVGGEVGRLLARCGLAEVVERLRLYQQAEVRRERSEGLGLGSRASRLRCRFRGIGLGLWGV